MILLLLSTDGAKYDWNRISCPSHARTFVSAQTTSFKDSKGVISCVLLRTSCIIGNFYFSFGRRANICIKMVDIRRMLCNGR